MKNIINEKLILNVINAQLSKGYKINDFKLFQEIYNNEKYFVAFSNSGPGLDDFGVGDTEKYKEDTTSKTGLTEEFTRDGMDIAENGEEINHKEIFKSKCAEKKKFLEASKTLKVLGFNKDQIKYGLANSKMNIDIEDVIENAISKISKNREGIER